MVRTDLASTGGGDAMKRGSIWHTVLTVAVAVVLSSAVLADGGVLRYRHGLPPVLEQEVAYLGRQQLTPAEEKPELTSAPALMGEPIYFLVELGEKDNPPYVALFDPGANDGKGALYFDTDHDGDLAEEEPTPVQRWGGSDNFGPIAVKLKRDGFTGIYHCWIERRQGRGSTGERWYLRPGCYNTGEITFEGRTYKAALVDALPNGRFNDICWSRMGQGDVLYVDWNGDGKFSWREHEYVMAGERYWRDGKWYRISFSSDGTEVTFAPGDFELAPLLVGHDNFWMQISSRSDVGAVRVQGTGGRVEVPVDHYSVYLCALEAKDDQGNTWKARAVTGGPYPRFEVKAGQENHYAFGPPFSVALKASPSGPYRAGQVISFDIALKSIDGKTYLFERSGQRMPAPRMVIRDESGKELGSYSFRYG